MFFSKIFLSNLCALSSKSASIQKLSLNFRYRYQTLTKSFICKFYATNNQKSFRHEYSEEVEGAVNNQILAELNASMVYLSMYCHYGRTDTALPGCQAFFGIMHHEELDHAKLFIDYQLKRGGQVKLYPITTPENAEWTDIVVALGMALELEKRIKEKLSKLYNIAECHKDMELMDIISSQSMAEQNESIRELGRLLTRAKRLIVEGDGEVGRHLFDQSLFKYVKEKNKTDSTSFYI